MKRTLPFISILLAGMMLLAACAPAATTAPTTVPATQAPAATAMPTAAMPTVAPTTAPTAAGATTAPTTGATVVASPEPTQASAGVSTSTPPTPNQPYTLGLSLSTLNNPFFVTLRDGAQQAADAAGVTLVVSDAQDDPARQASQIEDLISRNVDAILLNPTDSNAVVPAVEKANAAGIPVLTIDRSAAGGQVVTHIASDNVLGGQMAADFLCNAINGQGNVVELQGTTGTSAARDRGQGFDQEMASACPGATIVAKRPADFDRTKGNSVFTDILTAQPDIAGVFAQNDEMVLGAIQAAQAANRTGIVFVGFDAIPDALQAIKDGNLAATIAQQPSEMGRLGVDNAIIALNGESVPDNIPVPLKLITAANVNEQQ